MLDRNMLNKYNESNIAQRLQRGHWNGAFCVAFLCRFSGNVAKPAFAAHIHFNMASYEKLVIAYSVEVCYNIHDMYYWEGVYL